ncbi:hypothetical protein FRC02_003743 [Tulasnella sp. 418]|nr:hypothetical protein FRC02_003743 [Tulasnella sp. 418]
MDPLEYLTVISNQAVQLIMDCLQERTIITDLSNPSGVDVSTTCERIMAEVEALIRISELIQNRVLQRVANLKRMRNALALHIHNLPNELLSFILELVAHSIPSEIYCSKTKATICGRFPFKLMAVCSRWREVAISTPRVWSYLCSKLTPKEAQLYIDRSGDSPLDIKYHKGQNQRFITQLVPHIHRFRTLQASSDSFMELAREELEKAHAPLLESFSVSGSSSSAGHAIRGVKFSILATSHLRKLEIADSCSLSIHWESIYPCSQLTHLTIHDLGEEEGSLTGTQYYRLFKSLPCLEKANINARQRTLSPLFNSNAIGNYDPIVHRNLWSLTFSNISASLALTVASFLYPTSPHFVHAKFFKWSMESVDPDTRILLPSGNYIEYTVSQVRRLRFDTLSEHQGSTVKIQGLTSEESWDYYKSDIPTTDSRHILHFDLITHVSRPFLALLPAILPTAVTFEKLNSLRLTGSQSMPLSDLDLSQRLECLPFLEEMWLEDFSCRESVAELNSIFKLLGSPLFEGRIFRNKQRWICPNLKKIELHKVAFHVPDLLEMLKNRGMLELLPGG